MNRCEDISSHYWWVYTAAKNAKNSAQFTCAPKLATGNLTSTFLDESQMKTTSFRAYMWGNAGIYTICRPYEWDRMKVFILSYNRSWIGSLWLNNILCSFCHLLCLNNLPFLACFLSPASFCQQIDFKYGSEWNNSLFRPNEINRFENKSILKLYLLLLIIF